MRTINAERRLRAAAVAGCLLGAPAGVSYAQATESQTVVTPETTLETAPADAASEPAESTAAAATAEGEVQPAPSLDTIPVSPSTPDETIKREGEPVELEEVIVTAQKTRQTLRQVPASVTAISGEQMRDSKIIQPNDVNGYVPNTQIKVSPFAGEIRIRGYGSSANNAGFESSVGLIVDDVYYGRSAFLSSLFYDVDRFEVIRGPQGALFGKNTVAGVINIATIEADSTTAGDLTVISRNDQEIRDVRGGVSIPIADGIYSRIGGAATAYEGLYYNTDLKRPEADLSAGSVRAKLRFTDLFGGELKLVASAGEQKGNANLFQISKASDATLALFRQYDPQAEANAFNKTLSSNVPSQLDVYTETAQANYTYPFGEIWGLDKLDVTSITGWADIDTRARTIDFDFSPVPVVRLDLAKPTPYKQFSQELRASGSAPSLFGLFHKTEFVGGLYYLNSSLLSNDIVRVEDLGAAAAFVLAARGGGALTGAFGQPLGDALTTTLVNLAGPLATSGLAGTALAAQTANERAELLLDQQSQSYSAYGQLTTYLTEQFAVILGGRVGQETKKAHQSSQAPNGAIFVPQVLGQENFDAHSHRNETEVSPKAGVKYDITKTISTYAVYAKGFKGGGYNALAFNSSNLDYGPESAQTVEAGFKTRLFEGTLDANVAFYRTAFNNLQVSVFDGATNKTENAAAARSTGVEGDFRWLTPLPGTSVRGTFGYSDAHYTSYHDGPTHAGAQSGDPGVVPCSFNANSLCQDLTGRTLSQAPRWSASLLPTLSLPGFTPATGIQIGLEGLYTSQRYLDVDLDPNTLQKATLIYNARLSYGARNGGWSASVICQNITAEKYLSQVSDEPVAPGNFGAIRGDRGREYYGALKFNF